MKERRSKAEIRQRGKEEGPFRILKNGKWYEMLLVDGQVLYKKLKKQPRVTWIKSPSLDFRQGGASEEKT